MAKSGKHGIQRLIAATKSSAGGFRSAWRHEEAFRQEVMLTIVLVPLAFWLGETGVQRALLIGVCLLVLIVELLNSAIETVVDRVGPDHHELSGRAKDMGSTAVLLSLILAGSVWIGIAWDRFGITAPPASPTPAEYRQ